MNLEIKNLYFSYSYSDVLKNINLKAKDGQIVAILGSNGSGKTTLLKTISGLLKPRSGEILVDSQDISKLSSDKINKKGIIQSPEGRGIFSYLSVEENLRVGAFNIKDKMQIKRNFERAFTYFPQLKTRRNQVAGTLSGGEQQMLSVARALMANPKLLILDEPSLGLAPLIVKDIFSIIKKINSEGTTILIVEQNALLTLKIADYAYVLEVGSLVLEGKGEDLLKDEKLIKAYLGG